MTVGCKFIGGPLDGMICAVRNLPQCQIFFSPKDRIVCCYIRVDELKYEYEQGISLALTQRYDEAWLRFGTLPQSVDHWTGKYHVETS